MGRYQKRKTNRKNYQEIDRVIHSSERKIGLFLLVISGLFLGSFLVIIFAYNNFFRKFVFYDPNPPKSAFEIQLDSMVKGYPIERMVPEISQKDKRVAAFMISIAKKESNWGEHVPVYNGHDCYNYWGYRGENPIGSGGHTCFNSPQEAVETVSRRINELVYNDNLDSPQKMIIWKCGDACGSDNQMSVRKWIRDVGYYYDKILD
jgi:hypothetical protein